MSQLDPRNNQPFVPPPPPSYQRGSSLYPPDVLASKEASAASDAKQALIFAIVGLFCCGFIFGYLGFRKASDALETMQIYDVAQDKRGMATAAKIISICDIALWIVGLFIRFFVLAR